MHEDLIPVRRAQELFQRERSAGEVIDDLRLVFGLDVDGATAATAAAALLTERGISISAEEFVRPYMAQNSQLSA